MTDAPAAILATFSHFMRPIASRKVVPIVFEVPLENFAKVIAALGTPDPANPVWCGIALVSAASAAQTEGGGVDDTANGARAQADTTPPATKPKKRWHEMPLTQRAALLVQDAWFWRYLGARGFAEPTTAMAADTSLKSYCGITSKSELLTCMAAHEKFVEIEGNFLTWRQAKQLGAA